MISQTVRNLGPGARALAAALALAWPGAAPVAGGVPDAEHGGDDWAYYERMLAVIEHRYPTPEDPGPLDMAERLVLLNTLQILIFQAILEIDALLDTCATGDSADAECPEDAAALSVTSQMLGLDEACPVTMVPEWRTTCLMNLQLQLASEDQVLHAKFSALSMFQGAELWRIWDAAGRPPVAQWAAIPELRRSAELDAVLLYVGYVRLRALEEQLALLEAIAEAVDAEIWGYAPLMDVMLTNKQNALTYAHHQLERQWDLRGYGNWGLREWLEAARTDTMPAGSVPALRVTRLVPATVVEPDPAPTAPPSATAPLPAPARERPAAPQIWVRDGSPVHLPGGGPTAPPTVAPPSAPDPGPALPPLRRGEAYVLAPDSVTLRESHGISEAAWHDTQELLNWEAATRVADRLDGQRPPPGIERTGLVQQGVRKLVGAYDLLLGMRNNDQVRAQVARIKLVGGPAGILAMEISGFGEKLRRRAVGYVRRLEDAGYDLRQVTQYASDRASCMVDMFAFTPAKFPRTLTQYMDLVDRANRVSDRRCTFTDYSQIYVGTTPWEDWGVPSKQVLDAQREYLEDQHRRGGR